MEINQLWKATIYGGFAGLATLTGICLVLVKEAWVREREHFETLMRNYEHLSRTGSWLGG